MKAALPLKVVAVGRLSELECTLQRCSASAHGCDFEMSLALTLKVVEDGGEGGVLKKLPDDPRCRGPAGSFGLFPGHTLYLSHLLGGPGNQSRE